MWPWKQKSMRPEKVTREEIISHQDDYLLYLTPNKTNTFYFQQHHIEYWHYVPELENTISDAFFDCAMELIARLSQKRSTVTTMAISIADCQLCAALENWYDDPPRNGILLPSNYGMDVSILSEGALTTEFRNYCDRAPLGLQEENHVQVYFIPIADWRGLNEFDLCTAIHKRNPMLDMEITIHPLLEIAFDPAQIDPEEIIAAAQQATQKMNKNLEVIK